MEKLNFIPNNDFMRIAIEQAKIAEKIGEVPIGAVIVKNNEIISFGYNRRENKKNALLHAEICAIEEACKKLSSWRLENCDLYFYYFHYLWLKSSGGITVILSSNLILSISRKNMVVMLQSHDVLVFL